MVIETPLLRVSRPVAACSRCRAAKVKCDGKLPACTACERANRAHECSSTNDQFAKGKERSYVATLETRVEKLERKVFEAKERRKSSLMMLDYNTNSASRRPSNNPEAARKMDRRTRRRKEASDIDDLVADFGFLAVHATARDFYGFTSTMSYARLILSACSKEPLSSGLIKVLPPKYAATSQFQHYMNNVHMYSPVLDESTFYASVDAVYNSDTSVATPFDHFIVRMVLAIASISLSEERGDAPYSDGVGHINAALEHAETVLRPGSIASIQAMVLLAIYSLLDPHHFDAWNLIGAASRAMVDLGLHQEPPKNAPIPKAKLELRRRVFYSIYTLDRQVGGLSISHMRALSFSDASANVQHPYTNHSSAPHAPNTDGSTSNNQVWLPSLDTALEFIKCREMQADWYQELYQSGRSPLPNHYEYVWHHYRMMTEWYHTVPTSISSSSKAYFELNLIYSYILLLAPTPRLPVISEYAQRMVFEHGISYITKMLTVQGDNYNATRSPVTAPSAIITFLIGRKWIENLLANQDKLLSSRPPLPPSSTSELEEENADPMERAASVPPLPPPITSNQDRPQSNGTSNNVSLRQSTQSPPPQQSNEILSSNAYTAAESTARAITAIHDYVTVLSRFGVRFGLTGLRDRFQQESTPLLNSLMTRKERIAQQQQQANEMAANYRNSTPPAFYPSMAPSPPSVTSYGPAPQQAQPAWPALTPPQMQQAQAYSPQYASPMTAGPSPMSVGPQYGLPPPQAQPMMDTSMGGIPPPQVPPQQQMPQAYAQPGAGIHWNAQYDR